MIEEELAEIVHQITVVQRFDSWVDQQLEHLRGKRSCDRLFVSATHLGDFSLIWHIVGTARGLSSDRRANQAIALSGLLGVESLLVNQGVKRLFHRTRPTATGDERYVIRRPATSSFPSGHASAGFFAASLLSHWGGRRTAPAWFGIAAVVGTSRAYVRIHHASDIVGGAIVGVVLASGAKRLLHRYPTVF